MEIIEDSSKTANDTMYCSTSSSVKGHIDDQPSRPWNCTKSLKLLIALPCSWSHQALHYTDNHHTTRFHRASGIHLASLLALGVSSQNLFIWKQDNASANLISTWAMLSPGTCFYQSHGPMWSGSLAIDNMYHRHSVAPETHPFINKCHSPNYHYNQNGEKIQILDIGILVTIPFCIQVESHFYVHHLSLYNP